MDEIQAMHRRLATPLGAVARAAAVTGGKISCTGQGAEWTYVCSGESEQLRRAAEAIGAPVVETVH